MKDIAMSADVIIVGGSLAGLAAAIMCRESQPAADVLVVEKYYAGYAGKAIRGAGAFLTLADKFSPEQFVEFHTKYIGGYLNDQELWLDYAAKTDENIRRVDKWSGSLSKQSGDIDSCLWGGQFRGLDENGDPIEIDSPMPWAIGAIESDFMIHVRRYAQKMGIRFIDRVGITDLLTADGAVCGAVGYHLERDDRYIINGKCVVMANGNSDYRIMPMWSGSRGEGIHAAWRAGARLANCEFASFCNWISLGNFESILGCEPALFNAQGENIGLSLRRPEDSDIDERTISEWYRQMRAGNGPIVYDPRRNLHHKSDSHAKFFFSTEIFNRPLANRFWGELFSNSGEYDDALIPVVPGVIGEFGPLWVDHRFATSVPGLFSAGDACYMGCGAAGAVPAPPTRTRGGGLSFAAYSGVECGLSVAEYIRQIAVPEQSDRRQLEKFTKETLAPFGCSNGFTSYELLDRLQNVMGDIGRVVCRTGDRIADSLAKIESIEASLPYMTARDMHELFACHEVKSMVLCSKLFFMTSFVREESRGWFYREDFPERDDENWLKWITVESDGGEPRIQTIPIPMERYPFKPETVRKGDTANG